jgi:hypothetical protein
VTTQAPQAQPQTKRLSAVEVIAATLAAVSAAVAASALGVEGTVVGAAVGSVVATLGSAFYAKSLTHTHHRLKDLRPRRTVPPVPWGPDAANQADAPLTTVAGDGPGEATTGPASRLPGTVYGRRQRRWPLMVGVAVAAFGLAIAVITGTELAIGKPLANLYGRHTGGGTSIGGLTGRAPAQTDTPGPTGGQPSSSGPGVDASQTPTASTSDGPPTASPSKPATSIPPSAIPPAQTLQPTPQPTLQPTP